MPASWRTFTHAARHCSSVPYCCSNSASVSPCMIARIAPIPRSPESILHRFRGGRKGGDWLISGFSNEEAAAFRDAHLAPGAHVHTDGTSAFQVFGENGRTHVATITGGRRPGRERGAPFFVINTLISNLSTALKATYKVFSPKHLPDYLGAFCWTTNHRRNMRGMIGALCSAAASSSRLTRRAVYA